MDFLTTVIKFYDHRIPSYWFLLQNSTCSSVEHPISLQQNISQNAFLFSLRTSSSARVDLLLSSSSARVDRCSTDGFVRETCRVQRWSRLWVQLLPWHHPPSSKQTDCCLLCPDANFSMHPLLSFTRKSIFKMSMEAFEITLSIPECNAFIYRFQRKRIKITQVRNIKIQFKN